MAIKIINIKNSPSFAKQAITYFQSKWASPESMMVYQDCITRSLTTPNSLPLWYLLIENKEIVGGAGVITNDFISCVDLWPWLCALYVEERYRGNRLSQQLIEHIKKDVSQLEFSHLYLCTSHTGLYEKYGFEYIAEGYHPWGESSRVYGCSLK